MHVSMLALEANWFGAMVALLSAALWIVIWRRVRHPYALLCAWGWAGLCVYWSLLAVSAGPAPMVARAHIALIVRVLLVGSMAALGGGKLWLTWHAWQRERVHAPDST